MGFLISDESAGHKTVDEAYQKAKNRIDHVEVAKGKDQKCRTQNCSSE